jgi:hypothetical protein
METLGDENAVATEINNAPTQVPTVVNVVHKSRNSLAMPNGGVEINPLKALAADKILDSENAKVAEAHDKAKIDLPKGRWWWD